MIRYIHRHVWGQGSTGYAQATQSAGPSVFWFEAHKWSRSNWAAPLWLQTSPFLLFTPITSLLWLRLLMAQGAWLWVGHAACPALWLVDLSERKGWEKKCCLHGTCKLCIDFLLISVHNVKLNSLFIYCLKIYVHIFLQITTKQQDKIFLLVYCSNRAMNTSFSLPKHTATYTQNVLNVLFKWHNNLK